MPKMKTHKGAARRFKITGSGKILRVHGGKSHLRRKKAARVKALFDKMIPTSPADAKRIRKLLPYA
ncbi:MAG: 50S ribosomal protein L35 [Chloroflexota bacterium]|nr:50S ribosomal protein L35 [Dehalococcoidia bacterium]MDW8252785.1 50S ribosomal protein L35 [Chloroflexota bacterium]